MNSIFDLTSTLLMMFYLCSGYNNYISTFQMLLFSFFTYETEFVLFSAVLEFCLAHGLRQLTQDIISDVDCLQTILKCCNEKPELCSELAIIPLQW